jgi:hypothetical protein
MVYVKEPMYRIMTYAIQNPTWASCHFATLCPVASSIQESVSNAVDHKLQEYEL